MVADFLQRLCREVVVGNVSLERKHFEIELRKCGKKPSRLADPGSHVHNILPANKHKLKSSITQNLYLQSAPWARRKLVTLNTDPRFVLPMASFFVWSPNFTAGCFVLTELHMLRAIDRASGLAAAGSGSSIVLFCSGNAVRANS